MKNDFYTVLGFILTLLDSCTELFCLLQSCDSSRSSQPRCWLHHLSLPAVTMCSMQLVAHPRFHPAGKKSQPRCWLHPLSSSGRILPHSCRQHDFHLQVFARLVDLRVSCRSGSTPKSPRCFSTPGCGSCFVMRPAMAACRSFSRCTI